MNVQTIFDALDEDMGNSALGVICGELERQGYEIAINGQSVTSDGFFNDEFNQLERETQPLNVSLYKKATLEQEFSIEFTDYHKIRIGQKTDPGDSQG
jgi:hypothetical protein